MQSDHTTKRRWEIYGALRTSGIRRLAVSRPDVLDIGYLIPAMDDYIAELESALDRFVLAFDVGDVVHATANGRGYAALAEARALLEARDA